ncbi:MAG: 2'-5' RNA ligase family protein [Anaerolineales bacterium]|nr:2'-5' RNA ligase family protein [Anaerolineales bacterium]
MKPMHGLVSLLDSEHYARVEELWAQLETHCGLKGVQGTPMPHFSWQVTMDYDFEGLTVALKKLATEIAPFTVRTAGLGIFTGKNDIVLYISLTKDENLLKLHQTIWQATLPYTLQPFAYYAPENWMPHITLGHGDVNEDSLACATRLLAREDFNWQIAIDNLLLVSQPAGDTALEMARFELTG